MNLLVLGAAGFLGSAMVRRGLESGDRVTAIDSLEPGMMSSLDSLEEVLDQIQFEKGDILDDSLLERVIPQADVVFNCAAQSSHPRSLENPELDTRINCVGSLKILEKVRRLRPQAVVAYPSSTTVIGRSASELIDENHPEDPRDIYSANKSAVEKYHRIYHLVHDLSTVILRFPNLYGPRGKGFPDFGFANYFIRLALENREITIYGSGDQTRNLLYVEDAADVLYRAALEPSCHGRIFFAAHSEHYAVREVAEMIVQVFEAGSLRFVDWPQERKRIDVDRVYISSSHLASLLDWKPRFGLEEGLLRTRRLIEAFENR
jgi:UDP-glucose 4-epimerase